MACACVFIWCLTLRVVCCASYVDGSAASSGDVDCVCVCVCVCVCAHTAALKKTQAS